MHYYKDRPDKIEAWMNTLTDDQQAIFDVGFLLALESVVEQIVDSKRKILNKILDTEQEAARKELESRIYLLDIYEKTFQKRITTLATNNTKQLSC